MAQYEAKVCAGVLALVTATGVQYLYLNFVCWCGSVGVCFCHYINVKCQFDNVVQSLNFRTLHFSRQSCRDKCKGIII